MQKHEICCFYRCSIYSTSCSCTSACRLWLQYLFKSVGAVAVCTVAELAMVKTGQGLVLAATTGSWPLLKEVELTSSSLLLFAGHEALLWTWSWELERFFWLTGGAGTSDRVCVETVAWGSNVTSWSSDWVRAWGWSWTLLLSWRTTVISGLKLRVLTGWADLSLEKKKRTFMTFGNFKIPSNSLRNWNFQMTIKREQQTC